MQRKKTTAGKKPAARRSGRSGSTGRHSAHNRSAGVGSRRRPTRTTGAVRESAAGDTGQKGLRLNKYLADAGIASRRKAEELIEQGAVRINRKVVTELGTRVQPGDFVTVRGNPVSAAKHLTYILLNKPKDCITTAKDEKGRRTVFDVVRSRERLFPVGRLDRNTTGVLLITNDGELAHRLMHPSFAVDRLYNVGLDGNIEVADAKKIADGIELEDGKTQPCEVVLDARNRSKVQMRIAEGRNREIRRIFESLGYTVKKLDRKTYGTLSTKGLARGQFRHLERREVRELEALVGLDRRY